MSFGRRKSASGSGRTGWIRAVLLGGLAAWAAQAQPATHLNLDMQRAYVQKGRVGAGPGISALENQLQAKDSVAAFVTADSLFIQPLQIACTLPVCGWTCFAAAHRTH